MEALTASRSLSFDLGTSDSRRVAQSLVKAAAREASPTVSDGLSLWWPGAVDAAVLDCCVADLGSTYVMKR